MSLTSYLTTFLSYDDEGNDFQKTAKLLSFTSKSQSVIEPFHADRQSRICLRYDPSQNDNRSTAPEFDALQTVAGTREPSPLYLKTIDTLATFASATDQCDRQNLVRSASQRCTCSEWGTDWRLVFVRWWYVNIKPWVQFSGEEKHQSCFGISVFTASRSHCWSL